MASILLVVVFQSEGITTVVAPAVTQATTFGGPAVIVVRAHCAVAGAARQSHASAKEPRCLIIFLNLG